MKKQARHKKKQSYKAVARVLVTLLILITGLIAYYSIRGGDRTLLMVFHSEKQVADTSGAWNLILVDRDHYIPANYQVELTELSNGEKVDSRIYPELQQMFDDARAAGLALFVREGYRTTKEQQQAEYTVHSRRFAIEPAVDFILNFISASSAFASCVYAVANA